MTKGVTLGEGAMVGAGSLMPQVVLSRIVVTGNPAAVAREL